MSSASSDAEPTLRGYATGQRVFGRYKLVGILGRGGMGVVWRAQDEVLGEDVALKFLPDAVRWDPGSFEDLKAETRRARQLTHPNIVRIHDFVEDAGSAAISMEWVDGETLTALRHAQPNRVFEPDDILRWLPQLCAALDYAHREARVVHRDLKPSNLMLTRDGRLKITDFGVARSLTDSISRVSMMGAGTLIYMSPQQAMGEDPAAADDLYSLGATLYELLAGKPPFYTGDVRTQLFQRIPDTIAVRRRALGCAGGSIPDHWESLIAACLAKEATGRPASAGEIASQLARPAAPVRSTRRRPVALGGIAVALLVALPWVWHWGGEAPRQGGAAEADFPSDRTRALAAWNFDGDARDGAGRGLDGAINDAVPTVDRFGRIDRALKFNGRADVVVGDSPLLRWGGSQPFSAALWLCHNESPDVSGAFWQNMGDRVGSLSWSLGLASGRLEVSLGAVQTDNRFCRARSPVHLERGRWHHVALVSDGAQLAVYVDGKPGESRPLGAVRGAAAPDRVEQTFGHIPYSAWGFSGALDEVRIWRRALAAEEIGRLAGTVAPPRIVQTRGAYADTDDLVAAVRDEFGAEAGVLDWDELKRWHADDAAAWMAEANLTRNAQNGWLQRSGQRFHRENRHYFASRFDGTKPEYFLAHDEIGGMAIALGSWYGSRVPVFAVLPPSPSEARALAATAADGVVRHHESLGVGKSAAALSWRMPLRSAARLSGTARVLLADGREIRAECRSNGDASVALALEVTGGGRVTKSRDVGFGDSGFTLVLRDGRVNFRAESLVGANPLFSESLEIAGFRLREVRGFEIEGAPQAPVTDAVLNWE